MSAFLPMIIIDMDDINFPYVRFFKKIDEAVAYFMRHILNMYPEKAGMVVNNDKHRVILHQERFQMLDAFNYLTYELFIPNTINTTEKLYNYISEENYVSDSVYSTQRVKKCLIYRKKEQTYIMTEPENLIIDGDYATYNGQLIIVHGYNTTENFQIMEKYENSELFFYKNEFHSTDNIPSVTCYLYENSSESNEIVQEYYTHGVLKYYKGFEDIEPVSV